MGIRTAKDKTYVLCFVSISLSVLLNPAPAPPEGGGTDSGDSGSTAYDLILNIPWVLREGGIILSHDELGVPVEITRQWA